MKFLQLNRKALAVAGVYLVIAVLWIWFSDRAVAAIVHAPELLTAIQTWKGLVFVGGTGFVIYLIAERAFRREAETQRRADETTERYRALSELSPIGIYYADAAGELTYVNPTAMAMAGVTRIEELLGDAWYNCVHPDDRRGLIDAWRAVVANPGEFRFEYRVIGAGGSVRWVAEHAQPLAGADGKPAGFVGTLSDVTALKQAATRLEESEHEYRDLFQSNPVPMCIWQPGTLKFLAVNDAMVEHYGYTRAEFDRMTLKDIRPAEDVTRVITLAGQALDGYFHAGSARHLRSNGELFYVDVRSHPVRFGSETAVLAQITDITAQHEAETALQQERATLIETTTRLNHILATSPTLVYSVRLRKGEFTPLWLSDNIESILGYSREEAMRPEWWLKHMHPDDRQHAMERTGEFSSAGTLVDEFRFYHKKGDMRWMRAEARVVSGDAEHGMEIVGTWNDITEERKTEERLRLDATAFGSTRDGVMITDAQSRILSVNRAFVEATGFSEQELLGNQPSILKSGRHDADFYNAMRATLDQSGHWQGEVWNRRRSGELFPVWLTISAVHSRQGNVTHYVAIYTDISKLKQNEEELHTLAHYDSLTSLPNRLLLQSRLDHAVDQAARRRGNVALIFLDLDDFKKVNDSLGHVVGDQLLSAVAARLRARVREEDTLARLGGDEFVVLLETLNRPEDAAGVARDLLATLAAPITLGGKLELHVHGSIGISVFPNDGETPAELLRAADTAMYRAKDEGGDRFLFFTREMSREVLANLNMETALRQALARQEFTLNYQPVVQTGSGVVLGLEALLRWHPAGGDPVSPGEFIPVAERTGLIVPIGNWVLDEACRQHRAWSDQGLPPLRIAVNVSARQFRAQGLEATIADALRRHAVPPECLVLELTESMLMERPEEATEILGRLKQVGVDLALDDFGTGFSSLSYLTRFPVDTLKVDLSFVRRIEGDASARQIIGAIIELAHGLEMRTVAEGVETAAQERFLRKAGCEAMQGYLFSRPVPAAEIPEFVRAHPPQQGARRAAGGRGRRGRQ